MRPSWICKWRSKFKYPFVLHLKIHRSFRAVILYERILWWAEWTPIRYEAILATQMKVKVQTSLCFEFQDPLILSSCYFVWTYTVISRSYYIITPSWYGTILAMKIKIKGQISLSFVSLDPMTWFSLNFVRI